MNLTVAQVRVLQKLHEQFTAAEGRERASVLRCAAHGKPSDFWRLIGDLYGDA